MAGPVLLRCGCDDLKSRLKRILDNKKQAPCGLCLTSASTCAFLREYIIFWQWEFLCLSKPHCLTVALTHLQCLNTADCYGIVLPRAAGDGKQLLPSADTGLCVPQSHGASSSGTQWFSQNQGCPACTCTAGKSLSCTSLTQQVHQIKFSAWMNLREAFLHLQWGFSACLE